MFVASLNNLICGRQQRFRDGEAERFGGFEVDDQLHFRAPINDGKTARSGRAAQKFENRRRRLLRGLLGQVVANDGDQPALIWASEKMRLRVCLRGDDDAVALALQHNGRCGDRRPPCRPPLDCL